MEVEISGTSNFQKFWFSNFLNVVIFKLVREAFSNAVEFSPASKWLLFSEGKEFDVFLLLDPSNIRFDLWNKLLIFIHICQVLINMLNQAGNIVIAAI